MRVLSSPSANIISLLGVSHADNLFAWLSESSIWWDVMVSFHVLGRKKRIQGGWRKKAWRRKGGKNTLGILACCSHCQIKIRNILPFMAAADSPLFALIITMSYKRSWQSVHPAKASFPWSMSIYCKSHIGLRGMWRSSVDKGLNNKE